MCFGSPKAPQIIYSGPSSEDIAAQNASLQTFMEQSAQQQQTFASALQQQIDAANQQSQQYASTLAQERSALESGIKTEAQMAAEEMAATRQKAQLDMAASNAAAASENAAMVQSSYGINTAQATPANAQVTEPAKPKKPEKESLKIAPGSVAATAGAGLNIGV
jgi:hypothetical protein